MTEYQCGSCEAIDIYEHMKQACRHCDSKSLWPVQKLGVEETVGGGDM